MIQEIKCFVKEHSSNRNYIWKLAVSRAKSDTKSTTLGMYWNLVKDIIFFIAYGFFIMAIRGRAGGGLIEGLPVLAYLFTGLVMWQIISANLNAGANSIVKNKGIFTKIKFPILIIPTIETTAVFIKKSSTIILLTVILLIFHFVGYFTANVNPLGLLYALFAAYIFCVAFSLLMSGFYTISKDFRELYKAIVRIQFYFVPIFWSLSDIKGMLPSGWTWIMSILENLPFIHLVNSFRFAITKGEIPDPINIVIFLLITLVIFSAGCYIQYRLRKIYADFI